MKGKNAIEASAISQCWSHFGIPSRACDQLVAKLNKAHVCKGDGLPDDKSGDQPALDSNDEKDCEINPPVETEPRPIDCSKHEPQFLHVSIEKIRRTFQAVTQNAAQVASGAKIQ